MAKNENNSHAFIRKMVENIKQTKDAQAVSDPKTNEVHITLASKWTWLWSRVPTWWAHFCVLSMQKLYTVCDVAMHIVMSKSTTYSLESPKDPVLPSRFFTKPDKVVHNEPNKCLVFFLSYFYFELNIPNISLMLKPPFWKVLNQECFHFLLEFQQHKKLPPTRNEVFLHTWKGKLNKTIELLIYSYFCWMGQISNQ